MSSAPLTLLRIADPGPHQLPDIDSWINRKKEKNEKEKWLLLMLENIKHHGHFAVCVKVPHRSCPLLAWNLGDPTKEGHAEFSFVHSLSIHSFSSLIQVFIEH